MEPIKKTIEEQLEEVIENIGKEHSVLRYVYNNGSKFVPGVSPVYYSGPYFKGNEEIIQAAKTLITGAWLSSGEEVRKFEIAFSRKINQKHALMVNSGSSANLVLIASTKKHLNWNDDDEIITSVVGFPTTVAPIVQNNLVPVFVDIEMNSLNFDLNLIEEKISEKTKAIFLSPVLGNPPDMDRLVEICTKHNLILLLDDCDSLGSKWNGVYLNEYAYASSVSFYPSHHMSCSFNTRIPFIDEFENFNFDNIENIYNKYVSVPNKIKIITFDSDGKINWKSPYDIIRHELGNSDMYKLTTKHGRSVEITNDHSLFVINDKSEIVSKRVDELTIDDYVVSSKKIPNINKNIDIDLIKFFKSTPGKFTVNDFPIRYLNKIKNRDYAYDYKLRNAISLEYVDDYSAEELSKMKISVWQGMNNIPAKITINEDICRLLGYYMAEGSYNVSRLIISLHEKETDIVEDIKNICNKNLGLDITLVKSKDSKGICVNIDCKLLVLLFQKYFKIPSGSHNKRIPTKMYELNESCIKSFIYAYCRGDGSEMVMKNNHTTLDVTSVSKQMIIDFQYLLSFVGISGSFFIRNKSGIRKFKHYDSNVCENYSVRFSGYENDYENLTIKKINTHFKSDLLDSIPINPYIRKIFKGLAQKSKVVSRSRIIKSLKARNKAVPKILNSDLSFFKIRKIEKINYENPYVYDFAVKNDENFYGGDFGLFLHNTTAQGGMVVSNDKELMRLARSFAWWSRSCTCVGAGNLLPNGACGNRFDKWLPDYDGIIDHKYVFETMGYNLQPLDLQGSIGLVQLKNLDEVHTKRKSNKERIENSILQNLDVHVPTELPLADTSWFGTPIVCKTREYKERLVAYFEERKIQTRHYFSGNLLLHPGYSHLDDFNKYPEANKVLSHVFFIGCTPQYTEEILQYIEKVIKEFK